MPKTTTPPLSLPAGLTAERLAEAMAHILHLNAEITSAAADHAVKSEAAKAAKKRYEAALDDLTNYVAGLKPMPLFDRQPSENGQAKPADDGAWRPIPIEALEEFGLAPKIVASLLDGGIPTLGDLADFLSKENGQLTDIGGIGPAKAEQIEQALESFWASGREQGNGETDAPQMDLTGAGAGANA